MKKFKLPAALLITAAMTVSPAFAEIGVKIDGRPLSLDVPPMIINDRTMVPLRGIFEELGASVEWVPEYNAIIAAKDLLSDTPTVVGLVINYPDMVVNEKTYTLDSPPIIVQDRTMVPLRAVSEAFGMKVDWDAAAQTVCIYSSEQNTEVPETSETPEVPETSETPEAPDNSEAENQDRAFEKQVLELVNQFRGEEGLPALEWDDDLAAVARAHCEDMAERKFFSHENPDGLSPFDRMNNYGIDYMTAGENIASGQRSPESVMDSWMNSPGHRANILNENFGKIGVGLARGNGGIYWTQCFTD